MRKLLSGTELSTLILRRGLIYVKAEVIDSALGGFHDEDGEQVATPAGYVSMVVPSDGFGYCQGWYCREGLEICLNFSATDTNWKGHILEGDIYLTGFGF